MILWYDVVNIALLTTTWWLLVKKWHAIYAARKYWLYFMAVYSITEVIALPYAINGMNNIWLYNISKPVQFILLLQYFLTHLHLKKQHLLLFAGITINVLFFLFHDLHAYSSLSEVVCGAAIVCFCVLYFSLLIRSEEPVELASSEFWFISSLFIFYGLGLCVNGSMNLMIAYNRPAATQLYNIAIADSFLFYAVNIYALLPNQHSKAITR